MKENNVIMFAEADDVQRKYSDAWLAGMALLLQLGGLFAFQAMLPSGVIGWSAIWLCSGLQLAMWALYHWHKKGFAILLPLTGIALLLTTRFMPTVRGLFGCLNYSVTFLNDQYELGIPFFANASAQLVDQQLGALLLVMAAVVLVFSLCNGDFFLLRSFFVLSVLSVELLAGVFAPLSLFCLLGGFWGLWFLQVSRIVCLQQVVWLVGGGALILALVLLVNPAEMMSVQHAREDAFDTLQHIWYGSDTLPRGDLYRTEGLLDGEAQTLLVQVEQAKTLYLRGYAGDRYRDGRWLPLSGAAYGGQNAGILKWLELQALSPAAQYDAYLTASGAEKETEQTITVQNNGANWSHPFLPYSTAKLDTKSVKLGRCGTFHAKFWSRLRSYTFTECSEALPGELLYADDWYFAPQTEAEQQYAEAEAVYRTFVHTYYLEVAPQLESIVQSLFVPDGREEGESLYAVTDRVRAVLSSIALYDAAGNDAPQTEDPILWFLTESRRGNAAAFAAAGVEAFRANGFPARYAEGYLLRDTAINAGRGTVQLTDQDSHAWVEVYLDGLGWIPIDITPGFYFDAYYLQQMVARPQSGQRTAIPDDEEDANTTESQETWQEALQDEPLQPDYRGLWTGLLVLLLVILGLCILLMECRRLWLMCYMENRYHKLTSESRAYLLYQMVQQCLRALEIPCVQGWKNEDVDLALRQKLPMLEAGTFCRTAQLLEKAHYRPQPLELHELRVIERFVDSILLNRKTLPWLMRLKLRYLYCRIWLEKPSRRS